MSDPYIGEIRMFGGSFAPVGWHLCDGSLLAINQNEALFSLIGSTYGGDGQNTFGVPDLRGRLPLHLSGNLPLGSKGGVETVALTTQQIPAHTHAAHGNSESSATTSNSPADHFWGTTAVNPYRADTPDKTMNPAATGNTGDGQSHQNVMPSLVVNFIIALEGVYPSSG